VEDLLNELNGSEADVLAQINAAGNGIDIRSRLSGADFAIGENGGQTATQLGLRTLTGQTRLEALGRGIGVPTHAGTDFFIVADNGTQLDIDVSSATTIGDVIDRINNHPLNNTGTTAITARLAQFGNGIQLVDGDPSGTNVIEVRTDSFSLAAEYLGLVEPGQTQNGTALATGIADLTNPNSDLTIRASTVGTQLNGATIVITNSGAVVGDAASVAFNPGTNTLTIDVDPAATRAITVRDAINLDGNFTAELNTDQGPNDGSGLVADTGTVATLAGGTPAELTGRDVNPLETDSVFNTLIRLRDALEAGDTEEIQRTIGLIDNDILRLNFARAGNGARHQSLELMQTRIEDEKVELSKSLSLEIDVDLARAISDMTARQASLTASLRTSASLLTLSLLDFI
jgi:flagellin-like hook-associated protein FlgL